MKAIDFVIQRTSVKHPDDMTLIELSFKKLASSLPVLRVFSTLSVWRVFSTRLSSVFYSLASVFYSLASVFYSLSVLIPLFFLIWNVLLSHWQFGCLLPPVCLIVGDICQGLPSFDCWQNK